MQEYEKRILQCFLAEKITPMDLKHWPCFLVLKPEFITQIHMFTVYGKIYHFLLYCLFGYVILLHTYTFLYILYIIIFFEGDCDNRVIIVTKDKNVYSLGYSEDDCWKTSDIHIAPDLKKIEALCGKNIDFYLQLEFHPGTYRRGRGISKSSYSLNVP